MFRLTLLFVLCCWILVSGIAGCCGGGGTKVVTQPGPTTTLGKELSDLDDAYKNGVITEKEYQSAKEKLLKQRTE
jgi:hypothetical protein